MALWPYPPQEVLAEPLFGFDRENLLSPLSDVAARVLNDNLNRTFRLRYSLVTSADAAGMAAFFTARRGSFEPFDFLSPNDGHVYAVRFDGDMRLELFTPTFFRQGAEVVLRVLDPISVNGVGIYGGSGAGEGGAGIGGAGIGEGI